MKGRMNKLLALMLSASMAAAPIASAAPVYADDGEMIELEVAEEEEALPAEEEMILDETEESVLGGSEEETNDADAETAEGTEQGTQVTPEIGKTYTAEVFAANADTPDVATGMYSASNVTITMQADGTFLMHFVSGNSSKRIIALGEDQDAAKAHQVTWYKSSVTARGELSEYTIPLTNLTDPVFAFYMKDDGTKIGNKMRMYVKMETLAEAPAGTAAVVLDDALTMPVEGTVEEDVRTELAITNKTGMFNGIAATVIASADGSKVLELTLSGRGYQNLFLGTYEEAVANGDVPENWIAGVEGKVEEGKFTFSIPLTEGQSYYAITSISKSYYDRYKKGSNTLERSFYPRQAEIDLTAGTIILGDYDASVDLTLTNNVKMFKPASAQLETIGGPNSNNYKEILKLTMANDTFDKVFVGSKENAETAAETIAVDENRTFAIPVKANAMGGSTALDNMDKAVVVSFHSEKGWYERQITVSKTEKSVVIDPAVIAVTGIELDADFAELVTMNTSADNTDVSTRKLTAKVLPEDATNKKVIWKSSDERIAAVDENGLVNALRYGTAVITATTEDGAFSAECIVENNFYDAVVGVKDGNNAITPNIADAIKWMADEEITSGYDRVNFGSFKTTSRADFIIFLWRYAGRPEADLSKSKTFKDIEGKYAKTTATYQAIAWGTSEGIINGYSDGTFKPTDSVTRGQVAIMLWKFAGKPELIGTAKNFPDVKVDKKTGVTENMVNAIKWASANKLVNGYNTGKFEPTGNCLRFQMSVILYRYNNKFAYELA
ncbi:MAG: S-layer homology domain-containing protein [Eubacteriales bacterium]|nr:S-layer homology domain-containing protein [Eubacteriales bacterium]